MKRRSLADIPCSIARALDIVGEWWTPLILRDVLYGLHRFEELAEDLPIARNILSDRLKTLVAHDVLEKVIYADAPARYEYHLTDKGRELFGVLMALMAWGDRWEAGEDGPPVSATCRHCGEVSQAVVACGSCGVEWTLDAVELRPNLGQDIPRTTVSLDAASSSA